MQLIHAVELVFSKGQRPHLSAFKTCYLSLVWYDIHNILYKIATPDCKPYSHSDAVKGSSISWSFTCI